MAVKDTELTRLNEELGKCDEFIIKEYEQIKISTSTVECDECICKEIINSECENELYYCRQDDKKQVSLDSYDIIRLERDSLKSEKQKLLEEKRNLLQKITDLTK